MTLPIFGHSPFGNRRYWTRPRILQGLKRAMAAIEGPLPTTDVPYGRMKRGHADWPPLARIRDELGTLWEAWLAAGADPSRVRPRFREWTEADDTFLLEHAGDNLTLAEIGRRLGRTYGAVRSRLRELGVRARDNPGHLSATQVAKLFNAPHSRVTHLLATGVIPGEFDSTRNRWRVRLEDLADEHYALLRAPKTRSYRSTPPDVGDYYTRYGIRRSLIDGKIVRVEERNESGRRTA